MFEGDGREDVRPAFALGMKRLECFGTPRGGAVTVLPGMSAEDCAGVSGKRAEDGDGTCKESPSAGLNDDFVSTEDLQDAEMKKYTP